MVLHRQSLDVICEMIWNLEEDADISKITDLPTYKRVIEAQLEQRGHSFSENGLEVPVDEQKRLAEIRDLREFSEKTEGQLHELKSLIITKMSGLESQHAQILEKQKQATAERYAVEGALQSTRQLVEVVSGMSASPQK